MESTKQYSDKNFVDQAGNKEDKVLPVIEEQVVVEKKLIETGTVKIVKKISEEEKLVNVPVLSEEVIVERVTIDQFVDKAPQIRYEGDIMIIPVLREEVVIQKRLKLVEELHVVKRKTENEESHSITLKKEDVIINRVVNPEADTSR
jgi:uncharacterized protein (TIGR02271 family)